MELLFKVGITIAMTGALAVVISLIVMVWRS